MHLGSSNFLERFQVYVAHVQEWRAQFQKLESVDLRYEHQVIVNPDSAAQRCQAGDSKPRRRRQPKPSASIAKKNSAARRRRRSTRKPWEAKQKTCLR